MKAAQPPIRNCPFCRVAMVASRSDSKVSTFEEFRCLRCDTIIRFERASDRDLRDGEASKTRNPTG